MLSERGDVEIVVALHVAPQNEQFFIDLRRKVERCRKPFEREGKPERAIKSVVTRTLRRLKFGIGSSQRLQDRHQQIVGRIPLRCVLRDFVRSSLNSRKRTELTYVFAKTGFIEQPGQRACLREQSISFV